MRFGTLIRLYADFARQIHAIIRLVTQRNVVVTRDPPHDRQEAVEFVTHSDPVSDASKKHLIRGSLRRPYEKPLGEGVRSDLSRDAPECFLGEIVRQGDVEMGIMKKYAR